MAKNKAELQKEAERLGLDPEGSVEEIEERIAAASKHNVPDVFQRRDRKKRGVKDETPSGPDVSAGVGPGTATPGTTP